MGYNANEIFKCCVDVLRYGAKKTNMTYEEINILIFCIIEPIVFFIMIYIILKQKMKIKSLIK